MMRMKTRAGSLPPQVNGGAAGSDKKWELRPGGMLVQKRDDAENRRAPPPTIRVRVKYGSVYHEIYVGSQATFGELKKILSGPTGLSHHDQKLFFKGKERDSSAFLDTSGVKDKSKILLVEDPLCLERRYVEMRKNAKMEKAADSISEISLAVDRLASEVSALENLVSGGGKVAEKDVGNLIELLMNQVLKLDAIVADGEAELQRKMQVARVQKCVETLDVLKMKNHSSSPVSQQQEARHLVGNLMMDTSKQSSATPVVITTQWETFDPVPAAVTSKTQSAHAQPPPSFPWDLL